MHWHLWLELMLAASAAGLIDAMMGGGGLVQVPMLFIALPGASAASLLGTNKLISAVGTAGAAFHYARANPPSLSVILVLMLTASTCALLGASLVVHLPSSVLRQILPFILLLLWAYAALGPQGLNWVPRARHLRHELGLAGLGGGMVGFYDGIFGPGAGAFYKLALVRLLGYDFIRAAAPAKLANLASNLGALFVFVVQGHIYWQLAAAMALANFMGGQIGARLALRGGNTLLRQLFLWVVLALCIRAFIDVFF